MSQAAAQADSVTVRPGHHYAAGGIKRALLGSKYRDHWTTPVRVPVLDPDTFAGGLTLLQEGQGRQTLSLRFGAAGGREFVFRSVDKEQTGGLHPDLRETVIDDVIQDQVSSKHPGAALVVAPLLEAAGILHVSPTLAVMADDPVLGEFRDEFAGMLGTIEERPTESEGAGPFSMYGRVIGTERLFERLEESPADRVDARAYLAARLMDILVGDWDRHDDQWRWAQTDVGDRRIWLPIPRDRDNAFFHADGMIGMVGRAVRPYVIGFEERYPDLLGLTYNSRTLDRWILPELPRADWDAVALDLRRRLTDQVIASAVRKLPPEFYAADGPELERKLLARRDAIMEVAGDFYAQVTTEVDVHGTDEGEVVVVDRRGDGGVRVSVRTEAQGTYFDRLLDPSETREIRLHLHGGPDSTLIRGDGPGSIFVRVLGGGNDDYYEDSAAPGAGGTFFYDDPEDDDVFVTGAATGVDRRRFELPASDTVTQNNPPMPRDWGGAASLFAPRVEWRADIGPVVGVGPRWTRFGFRRFPHAREVTLALQVAPLEGRFGIAGELHRIRTGGGGEVRLRGTATGISATRFHGYGNDSEDGAFPDRALVWATEYGVALELTEHLGPAAAATVGPTLTRLVPEPERGSPADELRPPGSGSFTLAGVRAEAAYDGRNSDSYPTSGMRIRAETDWYPLVTGDSPGGFVRSAITATGYRMLPLPLETTVAVRAGGETLWGESPFQYAPAVGGSSSLRGYRTGRFIGDAALFGGIELRSKLGRIDLLVARGDFGTIALADAGRVFLEAGGSDRWRRAFGAGLWFGPIDREMTGHVLLSQGERVVLTAGLGLPF